MRMFCVVATCLIALLSSARAQEKPAHSSPQLARGRYLVENVAICGDCHSPHTEKGEVIAAEKLQGSTLAFSPMVPVPGWAAKAPGIAGLPGWSEADVLSLLRTGLTTNGIRARPPMPEYRLTRQDAAAVVTYLKSLPAGAVEKKAGP
jgi:mono/diheme cytochrome c family protein